MAYNDLKADGILVHMLLGKLKKGDIPADVRDACIRKMAELYFPPNSILITVTALTCCMPVPGKPCCTPCSVRTPVAPI